MKKELIITFLIILLIYFYYQQNNKEIPQVPAKINQLQEQVKYFQTIYQARVEKDVVDSEKVKELTEQLAICEEIINKPRNNAETQTELSKEDIINLTKQTEYYQKLAEQKSKQLEVVEKDLKIAEVYAEELETFRENDEKETNENLRKINLLFDAKAQDYKTIDFNGLYSLLQQIAEREREREKEKERAK